MEGIDVAEGYSDQSAVIDKRLADLRGLLDLVDPHINSISTARTGQTKEVWGEFGSCVYFAETYTQSLENIELTLRAIRNSLSEAFANIKASAKAMKDLDEKTAQEYNRLGAQFNAGPPPTTIPPDLTNAKMAAIASILGPVGVAAALQAAALAPAGGGTTAPVP